jgi:hypothetical protein
MIQLLKTPLNNVICHYSQNNFEIYHDTIAKYFSQGNVNKSNQKFS